LLNCLPKQAYDIGNRWFFRQFGLTDIARAAQTSI